MIFLEESYGLMLMFLVCYGIVKSIERWAQARDCGQTISWYTG